MGLRHAARISGTGTAADGLRRRGHVAWAGCDEGRDDHLVLDATGVAMGDDVNTARCDFWDAF
jgi:hypothetical protein